MKVHLEFDAHASEHVKQFVRDGVDLHNVAATGASEYHPVCVLLRNESGDVMGGLLGQMWAARLHVSDLWVAPPLRGGGHGRALLAAAERLAIEHGCSVAELDSFSFQAPSFYEKLGYRTFAVLEDSPPGHQRHFLVKRLRTGAPG